MNRQVQIAVAAVVALVLSGGGFVAGMTVGPTLGKSEAAAATASPGAAALQSRRAGAAAGGTAVVLGGQGQLSGRVISVNEGSITVELRQAGGEPVRSAIALVGDSVRVVRTTETEIKLADIKPGDQVLILGQPDQTTGAVSANAVIVGVSALQQLFGGPGGPGAGTAGGLRPSGAPQRSGASPSPRP